MNAVVFEKSIPRYAALKILGPRRAARIAVSNLLKLCPVSMRDIPEPKLPTREWLRVKPTLSGVCGSDIGVILSKGSPYLSPLTSTPFVLGHEVVGVVTEVGADVARYEDDRDLSRMQVGDRVLLEPALGCEARGIRPRCKPCANEQAALCRNVTRGTLSAGIQTGYCRDTGGGWSSGFVGHRSQLHRVPEGMSDTVAVLTEPLTCVMHGVLRALPPDDGTALVIGCGSIGLLTVAALRAKSKARIVAVAKHRHQREMAAKLGADVVLHAGSARNIRERYRTWADELNAELHYPEIGKPTVVGGASVTYDCVGSSMSIDDAVRFTDADGHLVLIGMPGIPSNIDWTAIWYKELSVHAAYAYGPEQVIDDAGKPRRVQTWDLAVEMLSDWGDRLAPLVGEPFALGDYRRAFQAALFTGVSGAAKTVFRIES